MNLLSDIGKNVKWNKPENMFVLKKSNIKYNIYWNDKDKKWGGLLDATIFNNDIPNIENSEKVDYRQITNTK